MGGGSTDTQRSNLVSRRSPLDVLPQSFLLESSMRNPAARLDATLQIVSNASYMTALGAPGAQGEPAREWNFFRTQNKKLKIE